MPSYKVSICLLLIIVVSMPCTSQWAHTFGWGGAGNGKRSSPYQQPRCQTDSDVLRIVSQLIQLEAKRLKACEDNAMKSTDLLNEYQQP